MESVLDCSRFWECGPAGETCLFECAACQTEMNSNPLCNGQWALTFDMRFQYPVGPVCDWPSAIDCTPGHKCSCLPHDGSDYPDCSKFVNPVTKTPYYHEHSSSK